MRKSQLLARGYGITNFLAKLLLDLVVGSEMIKGENEGGLGRITACNLKEDAVLYELFLRKFVFPFEDVGHCVWGV